MTIDEHLVADGPALAARVMDDIYRDDPFWTARFGARGRRHANEDGDFHLKYLREALAGNDPQVFARYARWLRELLCARGMCSRHLADHFIRLAVAIEATGWPDAARAGEILRGGALALAYTEGEAAALEVARAAAVAHVATAYPFAVADTYASFALDAIAFAAPARFAAHVAFAPPPAGLFAALRDAFGNPPALAALFTEPST